MSATLAYTVLSPAGADREIWIAPVRAGQQIRSAIVFLPASHAPDSAAVTFCRAAEPYASKAAIPLEAARFLARCHVEWEYPDDAGTFVVTYSAPAPASHPAGWQVAND